MTSEDAEQFLRIAGVKPTPHLVDIVKTAYRLGYSDAGADEDDRREIARSYE